MGSAQTAGGCFACYCACAPSLGATHACPFDDLIAVRHAPQVFLMRSYDIPYLNLAGPDLSPSRSHVFHVEFPPSWKSNDIRQLFSPVGQINISWIDECQCFVGLYNKNQVSFAKPVSFALLRCCMEALGQTVKNLFAFTHGFACTTSIFAV